MFEVLVYLYETYYRPDACPEPEALIKKLSAIGFEDEDITLALGWLTDLREATAELSDTAAPEQQVVSTGTRIYIAQEMDVLGTEAAGFIQFLEAAKMLNPAQREIVIGRALAAGESPVPLEKIKVIVLMLLWSQGKEPDCLMFDELFFDEEEEGPRLYH
jgi:Smg protein